MEFYNHIHCKYAGIKGFITVYNNAIRYRYMITEKAKHRTKVLIFWEKHGLEAALDAFPVKRSILFLWKKKLRESGGKFESLNNQSRVPKNKRQRIIEPKVSDFIIGQRKIYPRLGKEKLAVLLRDEEIANYSSSTVGRIIIDLKKKGRLPQRTRLSFYAKTGNILERKTVKRRKLRRKDYKPEKEGDLLQLDTIVNFINGIKRYVITAIDLKSDFAFAYGYTSSSSNSTRDFFQKLETVFPFQIKRIQTDNGSEFENHFRDYAEQKKIIHFHNYPRCPKMNAYVERFNRTLREEFLNYYKQTLAYDLNKFNYKLIDYLLWYNTKRPHWSLGLISPLKFIISNLMPRESNMLWTDTKN